MLNRLTGSGPLAAPGHPSHATKKLIPFTGSRVSHRRASRFQGSGEDVRSTAAPTAIARVSPTSSGGPESEPYPVAQTTYHEYRWWPAFGILESLLTPGEKLPLMSPTAPVRPHTSSNYHLFVGVAIAASTTMVAWLCPGEPISHPISIEQTPAGFARLKQTLLALADVPACVLIVMEATGVYSREGGFEPGANRIGRPCHPPASGT